MVCCCSVSGAQPLDNSPITTTADIFCNPLWVTAEGRNSVAQPGDALYFSGADRNRDEGWHPATLSGMHTWVYPIHKGQGKSYGS